MKLRAAAVLASAYTTELALELYYKSIDRANILVYRSFIVEMYHCESIYNAFEDIDSLIETGKPAPDIYLTAAKELGLPPQQCAAFEDSPNGIKAAHAAGCFAVMIPDMTQPDEEIKPLLSAVYDSLDMAVDFFERREK